MFETRSGVFLIAGLLFFGIAFVGNAVVPIVMYRNLPELTAEELVNDHLTAHVVDLSNRYPEAYQKYVGSTSREAVADLLRVGRKVYVGEACWHCHSQFVRPVSRESERWGPVAETWEYQNELQRPVLFGTRRVGPDLSRESARRSNDWHAAHFFDPKLTSHGSVMPKFPWLFDGSPNQPNKKGLALITYMQWLGSWHPMYPQFENFDPKLDQYYPGVGVDPQSKIAQAMREQSPKKQEAKP